ncbi:MAG TPA: siroheme synthase, partial [Rhodospirillaceae bacterium]|nr:siroheme synthase [Rhodospirillaceae bacterium]
MFPIVLDTKTIHFILIGNGPLIEKRRAQLAEYGAVHLKLFHSMPEIEELKKAHIVYVADLPLPQAEEIAAACRDLGVLVNVEDVMHLCDFHTPSVIRRGDLLLSVSTGGKSPGLAKRLREYLSHLFGPE